MPTKTDSSPFIKSFHPLQKYRHLLNRLHSNQDADNDILQRIHELDQRKTELLHQLDECRALREGMFSEASDLIRELSEYPNCYKTLKRLIYNHKTTKR